MPAALRNCGTSKKSKQAIKYKTEPDIPHDDQDPFDTSTSTDESDHSDFGKRRKKSTVKKRKSARSSSGRKRRHSISTPAMSDLEYDIPSRDESFDLGAGFGENLPTQSAANERQFLNAEGSVGIKANSATPNVIQIRLDAGAASGTVINLVLSELLSRHSGTEVAASTHILQHAGEDLAQTSLVEDVNTASPSLPPSKRLRVLKAAKARKKPVRANRAGFTDLPYELRQVIYREAFVSEDAIDFSGRSAFQRSTAFLRTCGLVHEEGTVFLYGENAFHFERSHYTRGSYFEQTWKEIGYKDVRRFLETIGARNIALMKYASFQFSDAIPSTTPYLEDDERRYVNDPVLHLVLRLIGANARLTKFAFIFTGRRQVIKTDYSFLSSLASIKSEEVIHLESPFYAPRIRPGLVERLRSVMTVAEEKDEDVDVGRKKGPKVKMWHERSGSAWRRG